ncbi:unnamed protein product [Toxocara canis]|uniref:Nicotianamine synthase n=1 Tax=Toxocara canis TaxID=6265 RepID=A0A183VH82_TOXCA|nr:unnamed protein product [Toxocara canis]
MVRPLEEVSRHLQTAAKSLVKVVNEHVPKQCLPLMDVDYLNRLKHFGSLPDSRAVCIAHGQDINVVVDTKQVISALSFVKLSPTLTFATSCSLPV